jgi:protein-tyrosine-phosphatase/predicted ATP-grasp superfamily ATP-dependent carboligase
MKAKVLVLGGNSRASLTVVRSLGRRGMDVHLAWHGPDSIVPFSRYAARVHNRHMRLATDARGLDELCELLRRERFDLVIPTDDRTMLPLVEHRERIEPLARLAVPGTEAFHTALDKNRTAELARELDVPVPRQVFVRYASDRPKLDARWKYPLVIKPTTSIPLGPVAVEGSRVEYVDDLAALQARLDALPPQASVLVQEYRVGVGVGVELLARDGEVIYVFQHVRVHEPMRGGGSSYRRSAEPDPRLLACAKRLMSALRWSGVAMVEFKCDPDTGDFVLLEINGRFWGSLPLAVAAGADFPYYLYRLLVEGKKPENTRYRTGLYCRNLRMDLGWFRENFRTRPSVYNNAVKPGALLREPINLILLRERFDTLVLDDVRPAAKECRDLLGAVGDAGRRAAWERWLVTETARRRQAGRLNKIQKPAKILFLCKGNICRSPFAETYMRRLLGARNGNATVASAGFYPEEARRCPVAAQQAARRFSADLSRHRSRVLSRELVEAVDAVFTFDVQNYVTFRRRFKRHRAKCFLLGCLAAGGPVRVVPDPYGGDEQAFIDCYTSVAGLVESLKQRLGTSSA